MTISRFQSSLIDAIMHATAAARANGPVPARLLELHQFIAARNLPMIRRLDDGRELWTGLRENNELFLLFMDIVNGAIIRMNATDTDTCDELRRLVLQTYRVVSIDKAVLRDGVMDEEFINCYLDRGPQQFDWIEQHPWFAVMYLWSETINLEVLGIQVSA